MEEPERKAAGYTGLLVLEPGLHSLVVDAGRPHTRHWGIPLGGAADRASWQLGNALVGNPPNTPALEIALAGPTLQAMSPVALALCGAPFDASIDGQPLAMGTAFTLSPGQHLRVGGALRGARAYLCVAGGWLSPVRLGSCSAWQPIRQGEILPCRPAVIARRRLPDQLLESLVPAESPVLLRALEGPQRHWFDDAFFKHVYKVMPASNRMGLRLHGPALTRAQGELLSEPVAPGAVQITHDGLPVILGIDGQTIGGYPKIAHVIRADLDRLAQLRPGDAVQFLYVTYEQAQQAAGLRQRWLRAWISRLACAQGEPVFL